MKTVDVPRLGRGFAWPDEDAALHKDLVTLDDLYNDVLPRIPLTKRGLCIQAGAAMGVWPYALSQHFNQVVTFEAHPVNVHYAAANLRDVPNVRLIHGALGDQSNGAWVKLDYHAKDNYGAWQARTSSGPHSGTPVMRLDWWFADYPVDLIMLDIEGSELMALRGAVGTIERNRPYIVLEDKDVCARSFGYRAGDIEKWLQKDFGYQTKVHRFHGGRDVLIIP